MADDDKRESYVDLLKRLSVVSPERAKQFIQRLEVSLPEIIEAEDEYQQVLSFKNADPKLKQALRSKHPLIYDQMVERVRAYASGKEAKGIQNFFRKVSDASTENSVKNMIVLVDHVGGVRLEHAMPGKRLVGRFKIECEGDEHCHCRNGICMGTLNKSKSKRVEVSKPLRFTAPMLEYARRVHTHSTAIFKLVEAFNLSKLDAEMLLKHAREKEGVK